MKNFGHDWRDGYAFNAMIHNIQPELVNMESLHRNTNAVNLENAFKTAETHLGIPRLLDPEGKGQRRRVLRIMAVICRDNLLYCHFVFCDRGGKFEITN